ncbi:T9SS type A sorting domain-containing protein [Chryseobacterium terrae]|uniref:T9SS type A sorting domain-containing protein n=1 Tax=Chryseobacterium terrae TaxID=3163299 RepID=A0ABW8Y0L4_9FLAO
MRKNLFSLLLTSATIMMFGQAQSLEDVNFNTYTLGDVASDVTGVTAGQGGYYIYNGTPADFQIVSIDPGHDRSLRITSGNGAPPASGSNTNNRYVFKGITTTANATNDVISGALEFYTGPATGAGKIQFALYDATMGVVGISYDYATKKIAGLGRLAAVATPTTPSFYGINLGTATYAANTWVSVSFTYNKTTGEYTWVYPEGTFGFSNASYIIPTGMEAVEFDVVSVTAAGNTVANQAAIDNLKLQYTNETLLGVRDVKNVSELGVNIFPIPAADVLNIQTDSKINSVSVVDLSGKKVRVKLNGDKVDVKGLPAGTYLINIETKNGIVIEKFIKK